MPRNPPDDRSWTVEIPLLRAAVIYESPHGNTHLLAEALARGLRREGLTVDVFTAPEAMQRPVDVYDLIVLGSPSHFLVPTPAMEKFLHSLGRMPRLKEHYAYAFDARLKHHPAGAAHHIEAVLERLGLRVPRKHDSALVEPIPGPGGAAPGDGPAPAAPGNPSPKFRLHEGAEATFEAIAVDLVRQIRGERKDQFD